MASISSQLLIDPAHVGADPNVGLLVPNVQPTLRRTYTPSAGAAAQRAGDTEVAPLLSRPDKTYGLAVASSFPLDEVFR